MDIEQVFIAYTCGSLVLQFSCNSLVRLESLVFDKRCSLPLPSLPFRSDDVMEIRYPVLENLWLDDNKLTDQATFATLAGMRK